MVLFKGRSSMKQYMPLKPIKRGYKCWCLWDSTNGYMYNIDVYTGATVGSTRGCTQGQKVSFQGIWNLIWNLISHKRKMIPRVSAERPSVSIHWNLTML
jgi:hypothetical protein